MDQTTQTYQTNLWGNNQQQTPVVPRQQNHFGVSPSIATIVNPTNQLGIPINDTHYASDTAAKVAENYWDIFSKYFQPLETYLTGMVNNPQYTSDQISQNVNSFNGQLNQSQSTNQRSLQRYGLAMTPDQQVAYDRMQDQTKTLGTVNAINKTNQAVQNNQWNILGGASTTGLQSISNMNNGR